MEKLDILESSMRSQSQSQSQTDTSCIIIDDNNINSNSEASTSFIPQSQNQSVKNDKSLNESNRNDDDNIGIIKFQSKINPSKQINLIEVAKTPYTTSKSINSTVNTNETIQMEESPINRDSMINETINDEAGGGDVSMSAQTEDEKPIIQKDEAKEEQIVEKNEEKVTNKTNNAETETENENETETETEIETPSKRKRGRRSIKRKIEDESPSSNLVESPSLCRRRSTRLQKISNADEQPADISMTHVESKEEENIVTKVEDKKEPEDIVNKNDEINKTSKSAVSKIERLKLRSSSSTKIVPTKRVDQKKQPTKTGINAFINRNKSITRKNLPFGNSNNRKVAQEKAEKNYDLKLHKFINGKIVKRNTKRRISLRQKVAALNQLKEEEQQQRKEKELEEEKTSQNEIEEKEKDIEAEPKIDIDEIDDDEPLSTIIKTKTNNENKEEEKEERKPEEMNQEEKKEGDTKEEEKKEEPKKEEELKNEEEIKQVEEKEIATDEVTTKKTDKKITFETIQEEINTTSSETNEETKKTDTIATDSPITKPIREPGTPTGLNKIKFIQICSTKF
jgi:hypothetical protein